MRGTTHPPGDVVVDLTRLIHLLSRVSPGPLNITQRAGRRWHVTTPGGHLVASFVNREADADLFARAGCGIRALATALAEILAKHADDGTGRCSQCQQVVPCTTVSIAETELAPLSA